ncbi:hypothetical protein CQJ30_07900 [Caldibacillus thermoamylovorans]|nr:hypothetical protein CQJ30_07900 [Caldibacillus thermoamylovorans]
MENHPGVPALKLNSKGGRVSRYKMSGQSTSFLFVYLGGTAGKLSRPIYRDVKAFLFYFIAKMFILTKTG